MTKDQICFKLENLFQARNSLKLQAANKCIPFDEREKKKTASPILFKLWKKKEKERNRMEMFQVERSPPRRVIVFTS